MRPIRLTSLIFAFSCLGMTSQVNAFAGTMSNFKYDYFEARIGVSPLTYGVGVSQSIHPNAHIRAEIDTKFESDFDSTIALGFHAPLNDWADIYGEVGFKSVEKRGFYNGDVKYGVEFNAGVRQWLGPQIEVSGEIGHLTIKDTDEFFGSISGRFHATELFSLGLQARFNEFYGDQFMFSARFIY